MENIFKEIKEERNRQDEKFGQQNHSPIEWCAILGEEIGEVNKAALETYFNYPKAPETYQDYREELIQVAAVSVAMVECIDRYPKPNNWREHFKHSVREIQLLQEELVNQKNRADELQSRMG